MSGKRNGILVVVLGLAVSLIAGCANLETETDARLDRTIEMLLEAIRARDDGAILSLAANPQDFGKGGRLQDDVAGFLYDGDYIRGFSPDVRSVVEIMSLGLLRVQVVRENGNRATALFIPEQFEEQPRSVTFYSERWMRDYFACEFHLIDGRWVLLYNICFALTDGPYPKPYGLRRAPIQSRLAQAGRAPSTLEGKRPIEVYRRLLPFVPDEE